MTLEKVAHGTVFLVQFPEQRPSGHEQVGLRPAIVVGSPLRLGTPRFPVFYVAPVTTYKGQAWADQSPQLYPVLAAHSGGLTAASVVLCDQVRAIDTSRVLRHLGQLSAQAYAPIALALHQTFGPT